jgi:N-succinyldiaminopimelate aminotransferase
VAAIARHQERFYGLRFDPEAEITVTAGATEAICAALLGLCGPGEEVVVFEPFYDSYPACLAMAGATLRAVTLEPAADGFAYDPEALAAAITPRTRALLLNTPHNPTGKVFSRAELEQLAELCRRHDLLAITDEVYEHMVFAGEHLPLAALPGMRERTVTLSSAGKTFSLTGWKVGWACAAPPLTAALRAAHQFITFCQPAPLQHGIATALDLEDAYFHQLRESYRRRRDLLCRGLDEIGFGVTPPAGTYFTVADIQPLGFDDCEAFCQWLPAELGVAAIPASAFYAHRERGRHWVRFGFCKRREQLEEALTRLAPLAQRREAP